MRYRSSWRPRPKPNPSCMHPLIMNTPSPPSKELEGLPAAREEYWDQTKPGSRVETGRVDTVMNLIGELIIGKSMLHRAIAEFDQSFPKDALRNRLGDALSFQSRVLGELQKSVMKIRMVPIEQLFRRLPRIVRGRRQIAQEGNRHRNGRAETPIWTRASSTHWPTRSLILSATPPITASKHRKTAWRTESQPAGQSIWMRTTTEIKSS